MVGHGMDMNMNMLVNETCCKYCFLVKKKRETTDAGSRFYALHQCFSPPPPPPPPQKHD